MTPRRRQPIFSGSPRSVYAGHLAYETATNGGGRPRTRGNGGQDGGQGHGRLPTARGGRPAELMRRFAAAQPASDLDGQYSTSDWVARSARISPSPPSSPPSARACTRALPIAAAS